MASSPPPTQAVMLPKLPNGFSTFQEIHELPEGKNQFVNIIGVVKDFMVPQNTKGSDWKCTVTLLDPWSPYDSSGLAFSLFSSPKNLPGTLMVGDIVLLRQVVIQLYKGARSGLSTNGANGTEVHVLPASNFSRIPPTNAAGMSALWQTYSIRKDRRFKAPGLVENKCVLELARSKIASNMQLPTNEEFEESTKQTMGIDVHGWKKFRLLKNVKADEFCDMVAKVVRFYPSSSSETVSLYVSDYTCNSKFYDYCLDNSNQPAAGKDGDIYGYTSKFSKDSDTWPGPFGKYTIQLTLWDSQGDIVRDGKVNVGDWVLLSNVQIKVGKGGLLEGMLRNDRRNAITKTLTTKLDLGKKDSTNEVIAKCKEALQRKREYENKQGQKRKHKAQEDEGAPTKNSKARRKEKRANQEKKVTETEIRIAEKLDLNTNVRCAHPDIVPLPLRDILKPRTLLLSEKQGPHSSPFTNCKYRAQVRIIDYFPDRLEDFAVGRRQTEYDILSDYSGDDCSDVEEDMRSFKGCRGFPEMTWEWRFALQVQDTADKTSKERMWLMVDNKAAQGLLNSEELENAANLRTNRDLLRKLRTQLFHLWGDLEEIKSGTLKQNPTASHPPPSSMVSDFPVSSPVGRAGAQPDADSDDENEPRLDKTAKSGAAGLSERDAEFPMPNAETPKDSKPDTAIAPKNKAFTCCVQQYGVKVAEDDPKKADAGNGQRWQRMFGLFGTTIS